MTIDHLDQFTYQDVMGNKIEVGHPQAEMGRVTTADVKIGDLPIPVGGTMEYVFDFGDWWTFAVQLESIEPPVPEEAKSASKSTKGKKSKTTKKTSKRSKRKPQGEIIESRVNPRSNTRPMTMIGRFSFRAKETTIVHLWATVV